jgi:hypothetical protein
LIAMPCFYDASGWAEPLPPLPPPAYYAGSAEEEEPEAGESPGEKKELH